MKAASPSEKDNFKSEILKLKEDLELRSAQIADINQKILDSDQGNIESSCVNRFNSSNTFFLATKRHVWWYMNILFSFNVFRKQSQD